MRAVTIVSGSRGVDSLPFSNAGTRAQADALRCSGVDFFVGYLGAIDKVRLDHLLDAGLGFMPVTFANQFDGARAAQQSLLLGLPTGTTVWLDMEGMSVLRTPPPELSAQINRWATDVAKAGFTPGLYVGAPQPFTSEELYALKVTRYWKAGSRILDRNGRLAEPGCGWCMYQLLPQCFWPAREALGATFVDVDFVQEDYRGRLPTMAMR